MGISNLVHFRHAVIEIFNIDCLNIFAYSGRPEVATSDIIFGGSIEDIEVDFFYRFRDPSPVRPEVASDVISGLSVDFI